MSDVGRHEGPHYVAVVSHPFSVEVGASCCVLTSKARRSTFLTLVPLLTIRRRHILAVHLTSLFECGPGY